MNKQTPPAIPLPGTHPTEMQTCVEQRDVNKNGHSHITNQSSKQKLPPYPTQ